MFSHPEFFLCILSTMYYLRYSWYSKRMYVMWLKLYEIKNMKKSLG